MIKLLNIVTPIIIIFISTIIWAGTAYLNNGFYITDRNYEFDRKTKNCSIKSDIRYPEFYSEDSEITERLNISIRNFIETYNLCNVTNPRIIKYETREGSADYFSIKWITVNSNEEDCVINSLSFDKSDGRVLTVDDILNPLAKNFLPELVKLSENHLAANINWEQFLEKIEQRYIQFYIVGSKWYIAFNPHAGISDLVIEKEIPNYLLKS